MDKDRFEAGMELRKVVLSPEHVERSLKATNAFTAPFQDVVTEYCWGIGWADRSLDLKTRSVLTLGLLACLGRFQEFEVHVRGARRNGVEVDELRALITHIGIYCGMPVAVECFRSADKVLAEEAPVR